MKTVSLSELRNYSPTQSVWLLNTTASCPSMRRNIDPETGKWKQERADVMITVNSTIPNERDTLIVRQSFLPMDATEYVTLHDLLNCRSFLKALREGLITVIDEASAEELFRTPGADRERRRLRETEEKLRNISAARGITHTEAINVSNPSENTSSQPFSEIRTITPLEAREEDDLDPTFVGNAYRWQSMDGEDVLNEIRVYRRFTVKEAKYLLKHLDPKRHAAVLAKLRQAVERRKAK